MALDTHHKLAVDLLKDLLLVERHGLPFPLFDPLLLQALAGIHFTRGPNLAGTNLKCKKDTKVTEHHDGLSKPLQGQDARSLGLELMGPETVGMVYGCRGSQDP